MPHECLTDEVVFRFVQGKLSEQELAATDEHLSRCEGCRSVVAAATQFFGARVERYRLRESLGAGAAGVVYRAFDPHLDRWVALKLVSAGEAPREGSAGWDTLLREARAMARLSHPNVVAVFDAGLHEDQAFVVMELVEGATLGTWCRQSRSWEEVLDAFVAAGRGLAAAHLAGLVHRDFKPENVLVGEDGRVRVTDFGLARPQHRMAASAPALTGTPAYMAPEQFLGKPTDARTDQFSFCVALFAALYGVPPFRPREATGDPVQALAGPVLEGALQPPPERPRSVVPPALYQVLRRGLSVEPEGRHPSMEALLDELLRVRADGRRRGRLTRWAAVAVGVLAPVAAIGASVWALAGPRCGNGVVEKGEECDDGNEVENDGCLRTCVLARCGDGRKRLGVEECDDGNQVDGDGCSARCLRCGAEGAGFTWPENGHCYERHDTPLTWSEARRTCARSGGVLVTYTTGHEAAVVYERLLAGRRATTWIGFKADPRPTWLGWISGERDVNPSRWAPGEPLPSTEQQLRCGVESPAQDGSRSLWATAPCEDRHGFVCERTGWTGRPRRTHAYKVFLDPLPWAEAKAACAALGPGVHLATVTEPDEYALIRSLVLDVVWIGGTDAAKEGQFAWVTGEPFVELPFAPGEPDDDQGVSDCLVQSPAGWHDRDCATPNPYVCEAD
jgi:cysteine-rich repeat protein